MIVRADGGVCVRVAANLDELRSHRQIQSENYSLEIADLKERCDERQAHVDEARQRYITFKRNVAANSVFSRSGKVLQERVCTSSLACLITHRWLGKHFQESMSRWLPVFCLRDHVCFVCLPVFGFVARTSQNLSLISGMATDRAR